MKRRKRRSNRYVDGGRVRHVLFVARKILARAALVLAAVLLLTAGASIWGFARVRIDRPAGTLTVNDVTGLNPIPVQDAFAPGGTLEIVEAVRSHPGPISIGGGRFSQGGQTAAEGSLHIDMRGMDRILSIEGHISGIERLRRAVKSMPVGNTSEEFRRVIASDFDVFKRVIEKAK